MLITKICIPSNNTSLRCLVNSLEALPVRAVCERELNKSKTKKRRTYGSVAERGSRLRDGCAWLDELYR